jgi:hypothetical protein
MKFTKIKRSVAVLDGKQLDFEDFIKMFQELEETKEKEQKKQQETKQNGK